MILISVKVRALAAAALLLASCGSAPSADGKPLVVVSTTVLGDLVSAVAGEAAVVEVLMPVGVDPHDFQPSSRQMTRVAAADLVVVNGLGLEEQLEKALAATATAGPVLEVATLVDPLPRPGGGLDPHVWLDPLRMAQAALLVADAMEAIDPGGGYSARGDAYAGGLTTADTEIRELLDGIPAERRLLVTNHEALGYFAARYGLEVVGVVVPGGSTLAEPSSAELAALVEVIDDRQVPAIFAETTQPLQLAEALAAEAGSDVTVVELFTESLGEPGTGADTLVGMLVEDARRIAAALGG